MIAIALACHPALVIADEPTTALDVTIQAQVLDLLRELRARYNLALLLITHDFGVIAEMADRVAVMYRGAIVEEGPVRQILRSPAHDYTRSLLAAVPGMTAGRGQTPVRNDSRG
jgi:ABC-type dipeptide/oligopeptide/nickel transport system ATPase component